MRPTFPFRIIQPPAAGGDWTTRAGHHPAAGSQFALVGGYEGQRAGPGCVRRFPRRLAGGAAEVFGDPLDKSCDISWIVAHYSAGAAAERGAVMRFL